MPPLGGEIRLRKDLEGIALPLVLRDRGNPLLQLSGDPPGSAILALLSFGLLGRRLK